METSVLRIETPESFAEAVTNAARVLQAGELAALPTETVYGLAANALNPVAVRRIFEAKERPAQNPLIVHVSSFEMLEQCVGEWPDSAAVLARSFWPGPLTLVLRKSGAVPDDVTAGGQTVGVRMPSHPLMLKVIERCGFPLAAPSANRSNEISPTTAGHVAQSLGGRIPLLIDAGPTSVGIESTVLDLTVWPPVVLRPGMISAGQISRALGVPVESIARSDGVLKSPGRLEKHYSPKARVVLARWDGDQDLMTIANSLGGELQGIHVIAHDQIPLANPFGRVAIIPNDAEAYARAIYAELHRSDDLGARTILIESPPASEEWDGIRDRLARASA